MYGSGSQPPSPSAWEIFGLSTEGPKQGTSYGSAFPLWMPTSTSKSCLPYLRPERK